MDTTPPITHVSLCAGYGGIDLGLKRAIPNLRTIAFSEIEAFACANLVAKMEAGLLDPAPIWTDLKTFPWSDFRDRVDILSGGYPCQPFSAAGKRLGAEDPRHLWPHISAGIAAMRPSVCFFENVEGHISLGLPDVIEDLAGLGYRTTWGIFSASEVGAPHQRKRVFILAHAANWRGEGLHDWNAKSADAVSCCAWPSRPGEQQHWWEPPRVVGTVPAKLANFCSRDAQSWGDTAPAGGESVSAWRQSEDSMPNGGSSVCGGNQGDESTPRVVGNATSQRPQERPQGCVDSPIQAAQCGSGSKGERQTQPPLGECFDEYSSFLGQALTLNPYGDSVYAYENISKKIRAREVLFSVWREAISKEIQWTAGGLQCFLAEKVLQSGMQLDSFTQRICYFIWCIQSGHKAQGWGLRGMWVCETCGNSSQGQEPVEQFKRELGYSMCQLSYEIALEGRKDAVETEGIMQGVREASERAWALSQAPPEMEEIWRSSLDQAVWEKGCYIEATSIGNRTDELRLLGNGVVPATAERAFAILIKEVYND